MIQPIIKADTAAINTAAAAKSFINFICVLFSFVIKSERFSIAVLNNSAAQTIPIAKTMKINSDLLQ